jgi:hypothetical protein
MPRFDRLVRDFKACRGPFPYRDLVWLLAQLGYAESATGGGSRRRFVHGTTGHIIRLHEPHPGTEVLEYVVKQVRLSLVEQGLI